MMKKFVLISFCFLSFTCDLAYSKSSPKDSIPSLHQAILENRADVVDLLLKKGDDPMSKDSLDETPLMYACKKKDVNFEILQLLLKKKIEILYESDSTFNSALYYAIDNSNEKLVSLLISNFSKTEEKKFKDYPFYITYSIVANEPSIFNLLLSYQQEIGGGVFQTYFEEALENLVHCDNLLSSKLNWKGKESISNDSAVAMLKILFEKGYDFNEEGLLTKIFNIAIRSPLAIDLLIDNGLDLNIPIDNHENTESMVGSFIRTIVSNSNDNLNAIGEDANLFETEKIARYFAVLNKMEKKKAKLLNGYEDLYDYLIVESVLQNKLNILKYLNQQGKLRNVTDTNEKTIYAIALDKGYSEVAEFLISKGL